jgi:hypothetical protein
MAARMSHSERAELWERLSIVGRVLKLQQIVTWTIRLALVGLLIDCLWLAGSRFLPYIVPTTILPAIPLGLAALGALIVAFWRPSMPHIARHVDRQLGLKERLITAVELQGGGPGSRDDGSAAERHPHLAPLQLGDAVDHVRRVEPVEAFPIRVSFRELNAALALVLVVVLLAVLPNSMQQTVRQREQVQQAIKQEAERLEKLADEVAKMNLEDPSEDLQQVEQALREGAEALEQRSLSGEEALAAMAALEQRLQTLQGQGVGNLDDALSALAGSLAQDPSTRQLGTSLAKGDYKQAAEEMRRLGQQAESLSPAERARLARAMRQAGQRASRANPSLGQSLSQSANALEQGTPGESQTALENAAGQVERAAGQLRAGSERERAQAQLQQSRSSISRSVQQQQAQARGQSGGQQQAGAQEGNGSPAGEEGAGEATGQSGSQGESANGDRPGGSGAGTGTNPRNEEVFDPGLGASRQENFNPNQPFEPSDSFDNPNPEEAYRNDAQVGYSQVHARYQEKAVQSLQNSYIPIGMKDLVKDYFSSLSPGN